MRWKVLGGLKSEEREKRQEELIKILFKNRGLVAKKDRDDFLDPPDPFSFSLKKLGIRSSEIKKAVSRVKKAIDDNEEIVVYGDYDVDGICATAVLWETLHLLGAKVMPYIPDRVNEGYGLNKERLQKLKEQIPDLGLVVTVDQGITAGGKIDFAKKLGIDVIVTDHHEIGKNKPKASAVVHTTLLSGVGVAWVLARELVLAFDRGKKEVLGEKLELVAMGTITDLLSLAGLNRSFVKWGFRHLNKTRRMGFKALFQEAGIKKGEVGTYQVGFMIGPRLNAAGRVGDALDSLRLLCTKDFGRAVLLAKKLEEANYSRQRITEDVLLKARENWLSQDIGGKKLIFVDGVDWEEGVIGLAASRLAEEFYLPVVVVSRGKEKAKASARSIKGFNIIEAVREAENLLLDAGGHPMAAGFSVLTSNLADLKKKLTEIAEQRIDSRILEKTLEVDCEVDFSDLNLNLLSNILDFAPFGVGNPQPDFVTRGVEVVEARLVGKDDRHLKLRLCCGITKKIFGAIGFGMSEYYSKLTEGKKVDVVYNLLLNEWNGRRSLELKLKDIKVSD